MVRTGAGARQLELVQGLHTSHSLTGGGEGRGGEGRGGKGREGEGRGRGEESMYI